MPNAHRTGTLSTSCEQKKKNCVYLDIELQPFLSSIIDENGTVYSADILFVGRCMHILFRTFPFVCCVFFFTFHYCYFHWIAITSYRNMHRHTASAHQPNICKSNSYCSHGMCVCIKTDTYTTSAVNGPTDTRDTQKLNYNVFRAEIFSCRIFVSSIRPMALLSLYWKRDRGCAPVRTWDAPMSGLVWFCKSKWDDCLCQNKHSAISLSWLTAPTTVYARWSHTDSIPIQNMIRVLIQA